MKPRLVQTLFHISDGINYLAAGMCLILALVTPFVIGIMHGFEGQPVTTIDKAFVFMIYIVLSGLFLLIARHNIYALAIMVVLYLVLAIGAKYMFPLALAYVVITSLPFLLTLKRVYTGQHT